MTMKQILGCIVIVIVVVVVMWKWQIACQDCICPECEPPGKQVVCGPGTKETVDYTSSGAGDQTICVPILPPTICGAGTREGDGPSGTVERDVIECEADSPTVCGPGTVPSATTVELDGPSGTVERDGFQCVPEGGGPQ